MYKVGDLFFVSVLQSKLYSAEVCCEKQDRIEVDFISLIGN